MLWKKAINVLRLMRSRIRMTSTRFQRGAKQHAIRIFSSHVPPRRQQSYIEESRVRKTIDFNIAKVLHLTNMSRTRSMNAKTKEQPAGLDQCDQELSDQTEATPAADAFKSQLTKYRYAETSGSSKDGVGNAARPQRAVKRARTSEVSIEEIAPTSPRPTKKRTSSKYADPSKYAHLSPLIDILEPNLICVFVGTNPGVQTATAGHAYAHPSNHFWKLLHSSGLTDRRLKPQEDRSLPALYCMGNTNIVSRPSKDAAELSKAEMAAGTADLDAKFLKYKPEAVCIVGKGIWESIWRYRYGKNMGKGEFEYGWQDEKHNMGKCMEGKEEVDGNGGLWRGARVFVTTSTSGLAASLKPAEKEAIWKPFGEWVQKRRVERGFVPSIVDKKEELR